jgi:hypothetical protein
MTKQYGPKRKRSEFPLPEGPYEDFPTFNNNTVENLSDFISAKVKTAIPVTHPAIREALIVLSLDPTVRSIDYVASAVVASEHINLGAIIVQRDNGRFLLDVVPGRPIRTIEDEGLVQIALSELAVKPWIISAKWLQREPRYSNALFVWLYNEHPVPREQRKHILRPLTRKEPVQLGQLEETLRFGHDPFYSIMSLACADRIELDLISHPIGRRTIVKSRTRIPR